MLQEFLLEVQTSGGGTDVSGLALILAQQLGQRRDEEAALLTALRCEPAGVCIEAQDPAWLAGSRGCALSRSTPERLHASFAPHARAQVASHAG